jgi:hypothetical protein
VGGAWRKHWRVRQGLLTLFLLLGGPPLSCPAVPENSPASPMQTLYYHRQDSEGLQPITLYADQITTWQEEQQRWFLAQGPVWINQGTLTIRCSQAVIQVAEGNLGNQPRPFRIYAEGQVSLEEGLKTQQAQQALIDLHSRGPIALHASHGPIRQSSAAGEALVARARTAWRTGTVPATAEIQLTAAQAPAPPGPAFPGAGATAPPTLPRAAPPPPSTVPAPGNPPGIAPGQSPPGPGGVPPAAGPPGPPPAPAPPGPPPVRQISILPRSLAQGLEFKSFTLPNGETAVVVTTGAILSVVSPTDTVRVLDVEADHMVIWFRGNTQEVLSDLQAGQGQKHDTVEFYLAGHVEIRSQGKRELRILRCDEAYYDVKRHVALALKADLEIEDPRLRDPLHLAGEVVRQQNENLFEADQARVSASALPYDPGLDVRAAHAQLESQPIERRTIFGLPIIDLQTGQPVTEVQRYFRSQNVFLDFEGVPIFYSPFLNGDAQHPLGPLETVGTNYNRIFGLQIFTTWDTYQLIGIKRLPDTDWKFYLDYLTARGPATGSTFDFTSKNFLGIPGRYTGEIKGYFIYDTGVDQLGATRGQEEILSSTPPTFAPVNHPDARGRFLFKFNGQDMPDGFSVQSQISILSDQNFLEQFYPIEFQSAPNQETFLYVKQQQDFWAWTALVEPNLRPWVTETEWLPKVEGYGLGISLFDLFTYNVKANAGYARLRTTDVPPFAFEPTDKNVNTARGDLWQDVSLPLQLGAFKVVPYGVFDLTYYTEDLQDQQRGRVYGAGGVRVNLPLSRLYPDIQSDLFNLNGIYHKIWLSGNYYNAFSDTPASRLPQLDRLNDDISDLTLREMHLWQPLLNPANAALLTTSPIFDPQLYAIRQLVLDKVDTRDSIEVLQLDVYQRWQTLRGFPGRQHAVDWMTLDLSASLFPRRDRDDFGALVGFLSYDWTWNIGDRTSLVSSGWMEPEDHGPRVFTVGANVSRPDNTNFYLGYRQLDPLQSKSVIGAVSFAFSPKYKVTASTNYDFGVHQQTYSLLFTRVGTDLQVSLGVNYNSILRNFGVVFEAVPNILASQVHSPIGTGLGMVSPTAIGR